MSTNPSPYKESLCLTCSSVLSHTPPSSSEKPDPPPLTFSCGKHTVCGRCQRKNRRLAQSCVLCESVSDLLGGGSERRSVETKGLPQLPRYEDAKKGARVEVEEEFVIGDDEDDEDEDESSKGETSTPPEPELAVGEGELPPPYYQLPEDGSIAGDDKEKGGKKRQQEREQCAIHYIKPDDTLAGLSLHYRVDGTILCRMNKLPLSTLSTTPHLLHTLPFLLLPPSTRSSSSSPIQPPSVERQRLVLRRFQVRTRCADWAFANAYVSAVFEKRKKEAEFVRENRRARGEIVGEEEGELELREGGELEEAVEEWEKDQKWEKEEMNGKGKTVGSRLRTTGLVERDARGWSWK